MRKQGNDSSHKGNNQNKVVNSNNINNISVSYKHKNSNNKCKS